MTTNDRETRFSELFETNNSSTTEHQQHATPPPKKKRRVLPTAKRVVKASSDDDSESIHDSSPPGSDSDSSVIVIGSLREEKRTASTASAHSSSLAPAAKKKKKKPSASHTSHSQQATFEKLHWTLLPKSEVDKRNEQNQLLSAHSQAQTSTAATSTLNVQSVTRRSGTAAADLRQRTLRSEPWTKVRDMCAALELNGRFTGVDIGSVHLSAIQIDCSGEKIVITHWIMVNIATICKRYQETNPTELFSRDEKFGDNENCHVLFRWVRDNAVRGGIFDSSVVFIEHQSFSLEMRALQTAIHMGVLAAKPSVIVRKLDDDLDLPIPANCISPAVIVSASSVKTCYGAYYPRVTDTLLNEKAKNPKRKYGAFGHGDHRPNAATKAREQVQYAENKKNSVKYGQMLISVPRILELVRNVDRAVFTAKGLKKDDIYDAMWIVLYGIETWLPAVYSRRRRVSGAPCLMYGGIPQRRYRTYDAMFEFAASVGTPPDALAELKDVLEKYRRGADGDAEDENDGD